ncbi:M56 family metallopeptidase [Verrucomicrobiales bacterium]|nr:M56 family metallopeptidase [Verrucomicrobiales bacterium]
MIDQNTILVLAEYLGKSAILIALGFAFVQLFGKLSPAAKHTLLLRVFAFGVLIPLLWLLFPRWGVIPVGDPAASGEVIPIGTGFVFSESSTPVISSEALPIAPTEGSFRPGWVELVFGVWILGMLAFFARSLIAVRFLRRLENEAGPVSGEITLRFTELRAGICPQSKAELLASSSVHSAFTWGIFRPRIVLPEAASGWSYVDLEMVLMHELEHVRRKDALAVCISRIFLALNWVNPLAWMAIRKTVQLREEACDRRVLRSGYPGQNYAEMLFRQASSVASPLWRTSATAVAETGTIEKRIKMILNPNTETDNRKAYASLINKVLPTAMMLIVLVVGMAGWAEGAKGVPENDETAEKLESLILPKVEFNDTPLSDALMFLQQRSVELDPERKGIVILDTRKRGKKFYDTNITLKLSNVPMEEALRYATSLAQLGFSIKDGAVVVENIELKPVGQNPLLKGNQRKMKEIRLPSIEFRDTPLKDALAFIQMKSVELDKTTKDRSKKGVNVILDDEGGNADVRITLKLTDVPLSEAFRYISELSQAKYAVEAHAIRIYFAKGDESSSKEVAEYSVEAKREIAVVQKKMDEIVFPSVEFRETPLPDALRFIQQRSVELDTSTDDPGMKGINVVLDGGDDSRVTLKVSNASLETVLKYTATQAGGEIEVGPNAVVVRISGE